MYGNETAPLWVSFNGYGLFIAMYAALLQLTSCALVLAVKYSTIRSQKYSLITYIQPSAATKKSSLATAQSLSTFRQPTRNGIRMKPLTRNNLHSQSQPHSICNGILTNGNGNSHRKPRYNSLSPYMYSTSVGVSPAPSLPPLKGTNSHSLADPLVITPNNEAASYSDSNMSNGYPPYSCYSDSNGSYKTYSSMSDLQHSGKCTPYRARRQGYQSGDLHSSDELVTASPATTWREAHISSVEDPHSRDWTQLTGG